MGVRRTLFAALLLALSVSAVNAYTVVMRDGRRVEIPNEFTVTNSTLTYEVSNGFQVTIQLNAVDIQSTERANREQAGSLLRRSDAPAVQNTPQTRPRAGRSITNRDLEVYRKAREDNDRAYEIRRRELGLPSMEDRRREVAEIEDRTVEQVRSMRAREEAYWRTRADALRAEMMSNQAQSVRQRPEEFGWSYSSLGGGFPGFFPFDNFGFGSAGGPFNRFRRFGPSPFDGFLSTPITPFPQFGGFGRRPVFRAPGLRINIRPSHGRHGSRR